MNTKIRRALALGFLFSQAALPPEEFYATTLETLPLGKLCEKDGRAFVINRSPHRQYWGKFYRDGLPVEFYMQAGDVLKGSYDTIAPAGRDPSKIVAFQKEGYAFCEEGELRPSFIELKR